MNAFVAGTPTLGFIGGANMTETFRGAILAIPRGQIEAGQACDLSGAQMLHHIMLPQMVHLFIIHNGVPQFGLIRNSDLLPLFRPPWFCAWAAFTLNTKASTTAIFASAIRAAPSGEIEAARVGLIDLPGPAEAEGRLTGRVTEVPEANPVGLGQFLHGNQNGRFDLADGRNLNRDDPALPLPPGGSRRSLAPIRRRMRC